MFDPRGHRILIVEDDPGVRELVTTRLELAGYRTASAADGFRALETISVAQPDAVVLDINMPGMDGFGVLAALSKRAPDKRPPVLVLTARNASDDVRRCIALGAKDYLSKPFDTVQLLRRIERLLRRSSPQPASVADDSLLL